MAMVVVMMMPAVVAMAMLVPVMRRRVIRARLHALLVAVAARLIGDLRAAGDIDRQMRVGADVTEVDRARLADAGGDPAVAAVLARRRGRLPGLPDVARRRRLMPSVLRRGPMPAPQPLPTRMVAAVAVGGPGRIKHADLASVASSWRGERRDAGGCGRRLRCSRRWRTRKMGRQQRPRRRQ
jgi:hypothetical protein